MKPPGLQGVWSISDSFTSSNSAKETHFYCQNDSINFDHFFLLANYNQAASTVTNPLRIELPIVFTSTWGNYVGKGERFCVLIVICRENVERFLE